MVIKYFLYWRVFILFFFVFVTNVSHSQWIPYYLPYQGIAYSIDFYDVSKGISTGHTFFVFNEKLFYTTDSGLNWIQSFYPLNVRALPALQFIDSLLVYSGGAENLYVKKDKEFSKYFLNLPDFIKNSLYKIGIDGSVGEYKGVFLKSTNAGISWQKVGDFDTTAGYIMDMEFFNQYNGFVIIDSGSIGNSRVLKTSDGGLYWQTLYVEPLIRLNKMEFLDSNTGFICGDVSDSNMIVSLYGVIYKTTNGGNNWSKISFPYTLSIPDLVFFNANTGIAIGNSNIESNGSTGGTKIFRTTDGGNNWDSLSFTIAVIPTVVKSVRNTGIAFASGYYYDNLTGIGKITTFKTTNFGVNWVVNYLDYDVYISGISLINQSYFFISGGNFNQQAVIYKSSNGGTIFVNNPNTKTPDNYYLYQNYPNPFNSSTKIKFECKYYGLVKLYIVNLQGKIISTVIEKEFPAGTYDILFNASNLSNGIYFYTLQGDGFKETKKMILVK